MNHEGSPLNRRICLLLYMEIVMIMLTAVFFLFIYLILVVLGLQCCMRAFSGYGKWGLPFIVVHGLLIAVTSLVDYRL